MKAVFLDRDGVINHDRPDYVKGLHELRVYPFSARAIRLLNDAGYSVFVVSNQQGVAKGIIAEDDLLAMQAEIARQVEAVGGAISGFYYCRHLSSEACPCRKPQPGLLLKAAEDNGIDLKQSFMIGDTWKDVRAGQSAGCRTVAVLTGSLSEADIAAMERPPDFVAKDLGEAAKWIVGLPA